MIIHLEICKNIGFERQIEWAMEENLPIIVHSREASQETFNIINKN